MTSIKELMASKPMVLGLSSGHGTGRQTCAKFLAYTNPLIGKVIEGKFEAGTPSKAPWVQIRATSKAYRNKTPYLKLFWI